MSHPARSPTERNRSSMPPDSTSNCSHSTPQPGSGTAKRLGSRKPDRHPQPRRLHRLTTPHHRLVASGSRYRRSQQEENDSESRCSSHLPPRSASVQPSRTPPRPDPTAHSAPKRSKDTKQSSTAAPTSTASHCTSQARHTHSRAAPAFLVRRPDPHNRNPGQQHPRLGKQRGSTAHPNCRGSHRNGCTPSTPTSGRFHLGLTASSNSQPTAHASGTFKGSRTDRRHTPPSPGSYRC